MNPNILFDEYSTVRSRTLDLINPLGEADCCVQSLPESSPVKWHLGHVSWFFEAFILQHYEQTFKPFQPEFLTMFSSYNADNVPHPDPKRGLFTRPSLKATRDYGQNIDERMNSLSKKVAEDNIFEMITMLGIQHELQHQELMLADLKHLLSQNPMNPAYQPKTGPHAVPYVMPAPLTWHHYEAGIVEIGYAGEGFSYDNESPRHKQYLYPYQLASRLVTNGEYMRFIEEGGYDNPCHWFSEGWEWIKSNNCRHPLYWRHEGGEWKEFTLQGLVPLDFNLPALHMSFYEASAFAQWSDARLPTEAEWEYAASQQSFEGYLEDNNYFHPRHAITGEPGKIIQLYDHAWEWTQSSYSPYPGYNPKKPNRHMPKSDIWDIAVGEYNSESMVNQYVLRGGACITPRKRIRPSMRNFFPAKTRWQYSGIRLARNEACVD
ncbi:ergothioneine biosynthesis protein EgtB [Nitrosomonas supralitoralis]|uniref:Ergothioneine biosynthesis protein EgtB n=1 Tax=Nitrosomonas supralitoralis TaxID=2116706 RepID=A0A2P7NSD6_9PROT|nr:ergothioneine biosynthesis protein EgtB [Nitrosomonas supralitoralis]PSJ16377.1 ergothioneine biosynthesis protein EgtB [Nitrosomonas supralitoralis]